VVGDAHDDRSDRLPIGRVERRFLLLGLAMHRRWVAIAEAEGEVVGLLSQGIAPVREVGPRVAERPRLDYGGFSGSHPTDMDFRILGPLEVLDEGRAVALSGSKQRALLALFLVHANEPLTTDRLIDELWGDRPPATAAKNVQMQISRLRKALAAGAGGELVVTRGRGYELKIDPERLDSHQFERLLDEGRSELAGGHPKRAATALEAALALWRGPPLADLAYEPLAQREIARLEDLRAGALEHLIEAKLALGRHAEVVSQLETLIAEHPYREGLRVQLMLALYRCDRQADALQAYQDARRTLVEELGIEPGERLRELERAILAQDPTLAAPLGRADEDSAPRDPAPAELPTGVVTFLLTDIEGSSGLWEADPEGMAAALELHDELIARTVHAHGGRLLKTKGEGDATVTAFRRASAAVVAAVDIQGALGAATWPGGLELHVRIALHTGEAHERGGDYFGPALNRAARLRALARGSATVVSQATAEIVLDRLPREVELVDLGRHELRGLSRPERVFHLRPVAAHAVQAPGGVAIEAAAVEVAAETPGAAFVGRERELAELVGGLDNAFAGRGRLFLLGGEPGIGKSRLAEELTAQARAREARVLVGRCWEAGGAPAYWPWVQALRVYLRDADSAVLRSQLGSGATELARLLPELRERFRDLPEPPSLEPEAARFRLFDAVVEFLRRACEARPSVLVLDDLHAADAPSLLLLRFLARQLGSARMLVLAAYRDVDPLPGQPLTETLVELAREPVTRSLPLGGLSEREVAEYLELMAPAIASAELPVALYEETEGNPLFVGELVRLLSVERVRSGELVITQGIRDVMARRLSHLSDKCNRMLVLASVLGREFALDALGRLAPVSEDELLDTLDEAIGARVLCDVPGAADRLRFTHMLIRDTLYEGLTSARRVQLHRRAVEALEALYGEEPGPHLAELAHHAVAGGDLGKGVRYARRAGDRALTLLAYEEAARLYATALEALDRSGPSDERVGCGLLLSLGEAEARAGHAVAAKKAFIGAADIAQRIGLASEFARAAAGYGGRIVWARAGTDDRLVPLLEEALAALGDEEIELRARLLARLAGALRDEPTRDRRDALSGEAVELARRTDNPAALAYALDGRALAIAAPDRGAECLALGTELREVAERSGDTERVMAGHNNRILAQLWVGDVLGVEADLAAASRIARELRQPAQLWLFRAVEAMLALAAGRLAEAEELVAQALALGERAQPEVAIPAHAIQRYTLCDFRGTLEDVEPALHELVVNYPARPVFRCTLTRLYARLARLPEAKRLLDELARDDFSALPFDMEWLYGMSELAEASALLGDTAAAAALYRLLLPWAALNAADPVEGIRGSVSRYLGILATTTKHWKQAERHFEDAAAMNEGMGARPWVAHTQHDYARMLSARDETSDRERALELIAEAVTTYRELGMKSWAKAASGLERALQADSAPPR
jgi:DNA-binding SARP family transcriptional activator